MTEEIQTKNEQKNTVALIGMICSIVGLIFSLTVFWIWFWFCLLFIWLILWIIWLFHKPRWKARVAVIVPLVIFIAAICVGCYFWSSAKVPAKEFIWWTESKFAEYDKETFDDERFEYLAEYEMNNIIKWKTKDEWTSLFENSTWKNSIEKGSYLLFSLLQQWFENAFEKYNNNEEINVDDDNNIIDVDVEVNNEDNNETETEEELNKETIEVEEDSEQNDIEQILETLE